MVFNEFEGDDMPENAKDLVKLSSVILTEITKNSSKAVVLLDCLDQIIFANSFKRAKDWLNEMKGLCQENDATLLLSIDPEIAEINDNGIMDSFLLGTALKVSIDSNHL